MIIAAIASSVSALCLANRESLGHGSASAITLRQPCLRTMTLTSVTKI